MKVRWISLIICISKITLAGTAPDFECNFNQFADGPIEGQFDWNIYDKVKDSSSFSVMSELGTSGDAGDKALVVQVAKVPIRCVTGEPVRWLPGKTLTVKFDFKVAVGPAEISIDRPIMMVRIGNSLLSDKVSWTIILEATANGDWRLSGALPDSSSKKIYAENFLIRSEKKVSISNWHQMELIVKKQSEPDSFEASLELRNPTTGEVVAMLDFTDSNKDKITASMWNTTRAHAGFFAAKNQLGVAIIDNLTLTVSSE